MMDDDELSALIQSRATRHKASEPLRASVRTQIALEMAKRADKKSSTPRQWFNLNWLSSRGSSWSLGSGIAGFACGVMLAVAVGLLAPRLMLQNSLPDELVADHVRVLKTGQLFQVASSDRHTVKPWFQGKLDYAPPVVDLEADGFPLLGGRVEHVAGGPVAALAYKSKLHIVNVFVWPTDSKIQPQLTQRSGFNLQHWSDGAMQVWVVSDLEAVEMERFGQAWRTRAVNR
jgi:anti-sigma factor RsiW